MSYLDEIKQDYVLGNLQVYREFDMSNFIGNAKNSLSNTKNIIVMDVKFDHYRDMISKALASFNNLVLNKQDVITFMNAFKGNVNYLNASVRDIVPRDVTIVKPVYLTQYVNNIGNTIDRIINNKINQSEIDRYISADLTTQIKRQTVRTSLSYDMNAKDLALLSNTKYTTLNDAYIKDKVLPFVSSFNDTKKQIQDTSMNVINVLAESEEQLRLYMKTVNQLKNASRIDDSNIRTINYVLYNAYRSIMDVASFMSYMTIHMISHASDCVIACEEVYNIVTKEPITATEGTFDNSLVVNDTSSLGAALINGQTDAYIELANNVYNFHNGMNTHNVSDSAIAGGTDLAIDNAEYNKYPYDEAVKIYIEISNGLDNIAKNCDDYLMVFDDIIEKAGFTIALDDRFRGMLSGLDDISAYTSVINVTGNGHMDNDMYYRMMHEIKDYPENMNTVAQTVLDVQTKLNYLKNKFEKNINGEFRNAEAINEIRNFLDELSEQYRNLTNVVAAKFMLRLKNIALAAENLNCKKEDSPIESMDLNKSTFEAMVEEYNNITDIIFEAMMVEYKVARARKERGVKIVLEDGEQATGNATPASTPQSTQPTQQSQTTTPATQQQNTTAQTNTQTQDNDAQKQDTSNTQQKSNTSTHDGKNSSVQKIINALNSWFDKITQQITTWINSVNKEKDAEYFRDHKEEILNKRYANMANKTPIIDYAKLMPADRLIKDTASLANKVSPGLLTPQKLQSANDDNALVRLLFANTPPASVFEGENNSVAKAVTNYYKNGTYTENPVTVRNNDLKDMCAHAVNYCETFYTKTLPALQKNIENIKNNLTSSASTLITESNLDVILGELFTEDENSTDTNTQAQVATNTITSMSEKVNKVEKLIQRYCNGALTASFDRYRDYMTLLTSIVPRTDTTDNNGNSNQPQQQPAQTQNNNQ